MKKKKIERLLEEAAENAKYDRDIAKELIQNYRFNDEGTPVNSYNINNSQNLAKLFEALSRSNEQIIKAASEMVKTEKEFPSFEEEEEKIEFGDIYDELEEEERLLKSS